jgi:hypothetical protein
MFLLFVLQSVVACYSAELTESCLGSVYEINMNILKCVTDVVEKFMWAMIWACDLSSTMQMSDHNGNVQTVELLETLNMLEGNKELINNVQKYISLLEKNF